MENMDKGTDSLAENAENAPEFIYPICLPKPKSSGVQWKKALLGIRSLSFKWFIELQHGKNIL